MAFGDFACGLLREWVSGSELPKIAGDSVGLMLKSDPSGVVDGCPLTPFGAVLW